MNKKNKIIVIVLALLVVANLAIAGLLFYGKIQKDAMTKLVNKNNEIEIDKAGNFNEIFGRITKVDQSQIEIIQMMQGSQYIEEKKRPSKKIKFSEKTEIFAPCPEIEHPEDETADFASPREDEYKNCPVDKEALLVDFLVTVSEEDGLATSITVH